MCVCNTLRGNVICSVPKALSGPLVKKVLHLVKNIWNAPTTNVLAWSVRQKFSLRESICNLGIVILFEFVELSLNSKTLKLSNLSKISSIELAIVVCLLPGTIQCEICFLPQCLKTFEMNIAFYQVAWKHPIWTLFSTKVHENIWHEHCFLPSCIFLWEKIEALLSTELNPGWWRGLVGQNVGSIH